MSNNGIHYVRYAVIDEIKKHPEPRFLIQGFTQNKLERPQCQAQVFADIQSAENFSRYMTARGIIYKVVPVCGLCGRIHVIR